MKIRADNVIFRDASSDPAKRPACVAALKSVDPKVATQEGLLQPYLQLGQRDLVLAFS